MRLGQKGRSGSSSEPNRLGLPKTNRPLTVHVAFKYAQKASRPTIEATQSTDKH